MRRTLAYFLSLVLLGMAVSTTGAQSGAHIEIYDLQIDSFPAMTFSLNAFDAPGGFISGLNPETVAVLEDGQTRPLVTIQELQPGVQLVVAINTGPPFALQDAKGVSRYIKIAQVLSDWAAIRPAEMSDDLSLVANNGPEARHLATTSAWRDSLAAYQPEARSLMPSLSLLSRALDIVTDPTPQPAMARAILFITPPPEEDTLSSLQALAARAVAAKVHVFIWMVASPNTYPASAETALKDLATQTGGQFSAYSGEGTLPDLEEYLAPLRHLYIVNYTSAITAPGSHTLEVQVSIGETKVTSPPLTFDLNVQPPNAFLVSPPAEIIRQAPDAETTDPTEFTPARQELEIIIEFPDGRPRLLARTALYVDGMMVAENTVEPFDHFTWDLSDYTVSGKHLLIVQAEDSLGLNKVSLAFPVTVTIVPTPITLKRLVSGSGSWAMIGIVALAGAILGMLLFAWRLRRRTPLAGRRSRKFKVAPLLQPTASQVEKAAPRLSWPRRLKPAAAYLVELESEDQPANQPPIPLVSSEMIFGSDPAQSTHVLDDPSVSPLHARLQQNKSGGFLLLDQNSIAGTWVNYEPVQDTPRLLSHGDVVCFGRPAFRFVLRKPPQRPQPRVEPIEKK